MRDHLPPGLPPDPFADDPSDPSAALDAVEPGQPLDPQERMAVEADLADLAVYEALLAHKGIRGLVVCCDECQQDHYHDWDMLRANLLQLLVDGTVRPHEPAYDPEPDAYVTWDYCRGYADASLNEATSDTSRSREYRGSPLSGSILFSRTDGNSDPADLRAVARFRPSARRGLRSRRGGYADPRPRPR